MKNIETLSAKELRRHNNMKLWKAIFATKDRDINVIHCSGTTEREARGALREELDVARLPAGVFFHCIGRWVDVVSPAQNQVSQAI